MRLPENFIQEVVERTDIAELIEEVSERVKERFGVKLEPEVIFLGDF